MKEKGTNKTDRAFLDVYLGETRPQEAEPSEQAVHAKSAPTPKRISTKMRRGTLEAYKQTFLVPTKLTDRRAVYLSRDTQERADFVVRRLGDRGVAKAVIRVRRCIKESCTSSNQQPPECMACSDHKKYCRVCTGA